jgi:hypothetical protein
MRESHSHQLAKEKTDTYTPSRPKRTETHSCQRREGHINSKKPKRKGRMHTSGLNKVGTRSPKRKGAHEHQHAN